MLLNAEIVATIGRHTQNQSCVCACVRARVRACVDVQERVRRRQTCADGERNLVLDDISAVYVPTSNHI